MRRLARLKQPMLISCQLILPEIAENWQHATIVERPVTLGLIVSSAPKKSECAKSEDHTGQNGVMMRRGQPMMRPIQRRSPQSFINSFSLLRLRGCVRNASSARCIYLYLRRTPNLDIYRHRPLVALFQQRWGACSPSIHH